MIGVSGTSKANILLFYTYRIFSRLYFHLAVLFVYFYINGIDFFYIELLLAIYGITLMISSQWKNKLFSHLPERTIISLGEIIKAVGLLCFTVGPHMTVLVIAQILSGVGYSLTAGTDSSLLKKMLLEEEKNLFKSIESSSNSYMFLSFLLAGIIGSILFKLNPYYVFYSSIGSNIICLISIWGLRLRGQTVQDQPKAQTDVQTSELEINKFDKFWIHYYAVSRAFPLATFVGLLPYLLFVKLNINLYFFGVVLSLFTLSGSLAARFIVRLNKKIGYKRIMAVTVLLTAVSMSLLSTVFNVYMSIVVVTLLGFASGGVRPLTVSTLSGKISNSKKQNYIFSSMEKLYGFWNATLLIMGGILFNYLGFNGIMVLFTVVYAVLILVFYKKFNMEVKDKIARSL